MKSDKNTKGAVSVFLVIILVPCLFISALFVDVGRVYLSKEMAYSAADLALNTTMTQYDGLLSEYYGLVASCQDMDEFYEESAKFFLRTISSQNLEEEEIVTLVNQYANLMQDDTIHDLLNVKSTDGATIEAVENANLANATMLKEQVVEFMKYRGPITVVTEIIDKLKDPSNNADAIKNADENEKVVKKKQAYAEAEGELLSDAYEVYKYLYDNYSTAENGTSPSNAMLSDYVSQINGIRSIYAEVHELAIKNLVGTSQLTRFYRPTVTISENKYSYTNNTIYSRIEDGAYIITADDWTSKLDKLEQAITDFNKAKTNMTNKMKSVNHTSDTNQVQYWKAVSEALTSGENYVTKVQEAGNKLADLYAQCYAMADCQYENITPQMEERWTTLQEKAFTLCDKYLTAEKIDASDEYLVLVNRLETYSANNINNIKSSTLIVPSTELSVDATLSKYKETMDSIINKCNTYISVLDTVINGNQSLNICSISNLKNDAKDYENKYASYESSVNNLSSSTFKESEMQVIETDKNSYADINEDSVKELEERLKNIRTQFEAVKTAAESMKYGSYALNNIQSYSTMKTAAGTVVKESEIGLTNTQLKKYADTTFQTLFTPTAGSGDSAVKIETSNAYNLTLIPPNTQGESGEVDVPELYRYLHLKFKDASENKVDEVKEEVDEAKKKQDEDNSLETASSLFTTYPDSIGDTITGATGDVRGSACNVLDGIGALASIIDNLISGDYDAIRDELYIAIYMTQMFSYATYEREGKYHLYDETSSTNVKSLTSENFTSMYETVSGDGEGKWGSTKTWDTYNKSLTNQLINSTNNPAYRCEIEYILYGNKSNESNIKTAFGNIFAVRAALNTVSAFQYFWTDTTIEGIAASASAATMGVVPVSVIKVALLLVQSALETCNDMNRLAAGWPVELYKNRDQWQKSFSLTSSIKDATNSMSSIIGYTNKDAIGFFYSDYLTLFICMGILSDSKSEDMVLRMGDVIQHNMKAISKQDEYALSNAVTHFKFSGTLEIEPLIANAPLFNEYNSLFDSDVKWGQYKLELIRGY